MKTRTNSGFTWVEIMIVISIIGLMAAIAIPNIMSAREGSHVKACVANLKKIEAIKSQWNDVAVRANSTNAPTAEELLKLIPFGTTCPAGGIYTIGDLHTEATCSYSRRLGSGVITHILPWK